MKNLAEYLAEYIDHEEYKPCKEETGVLREIIEQGIEAYQSTEGCIVDIKLQSKIAAEMAQINEEVALFKELKEQRDDCLAACKYTREKLRGVKGKTFNIMPIINAINKAGPPEQPEERTAYKVGQTTQIYDKEGNTCIVPKAKIYEVSEQGDGSYSIEITGSKDEDEKQYYHENEYIIYILEEPSEKQDKLKYFCTGSGRIELFMSMEQAESISHSGLCDADVLALSKQPEIRKQLDAISIEVLIVELAEYGTWNDEELKDHEQNLQRLLWIAGGDILDGK